MTFSLLSPTAHALWANLSSWAVTLLATSSALQSAIFTLFSFHPLELVLNTAQFAKSLAMLGSSEDNTALSRALSQLAEVEEKIEQLHQEQANNDFFLLAELLSDYVRLLSVVRVSNPHILSIAGKPSASHKNGPGLARTWPLELGQAKKWPPSFLRWRCRSRLKVPA